jgi:GT2 family glycosyltransferase
MNIKIDCFLAFAGEKETQETISQFNKSSIVQSVFVISPIPAQFEGAETLVVKNPFSTQSMRLIAEEASASFVLFALQDTQLELGQFALERMAGLIESSGAAMLYSDYYELKDGIRNQHPVTGYQHGSLRDDFNFGPVQLFRADVLKSFLNEATTDWKHAGFYALRLLASRMDELLRVPEFLFTKLEADIRQSGEKQFDYVKASARERQIEMEQACTGHLKKIGAFLSPGSFKEVHFEGDFSVEATVVIPVRNRIKTIKDAVDSVLKQKTNFSFNLIVVDNHSTDGTTELLQKYNDGRLLHVIPERADLGIGGCWNEAVFHRQCGRFAVQLDSDDLYLDETTLQKIVDKFYLEKCAMVIGSYQMCNFDLQEIPPGLIDHKEWTPENGPNNALRINGLGAPRAFYTPVLREIRVPNTSYGEDYAVGLAISRSYKIGRIYDAIYLCRRWEDNSDASLDVAKENMHNVYKDSLRTLELKARMRKIEGIDEIGKD